MSVRAHLYERHCYHKDVIAATDRAYFLLWNLSGQLVGYQQYIPNAPKKGKDPRILRYFTRGTGAWGLQYLNPSLTDLYVCEGVFDAVKLQNLGLNAIAVLGNSPKPLKSWLSSLSYKTTAVCDGDSAGRKLAGCCDCAIYLPDGRDLGDMKYSEILRVLK